MAAIIFIFCAANKTEADELREVNQEEADFLAATVAPEPARDEKFGVYLQRLQFDFLNKENRKCTVEIRGDLAEMFVVGEMFNMSAEKVFKEIRKPDEFIDDEVVSLWRLFRYITSRAQLELKSVGERKFVMKGMEGRKVPFDNR